MEKQTASDALDRALTDLYRIDLPDGYRAAWRAAVKREELKTMNQPRRKSPFLRVALPMAAALVLVFGAISVGNLQPTLLANPSQALYDAAEPGGYAAKDSAPLATSAPMYGANEWSAADSAVAPETAYRAASELGMVAGGTFTAAAPAGGGDVPAQSAAKIVRTADLTIATTAFDADTAAMQTLTESVGGYIASVNVSGEASERMDRVAYYSLRIPSAKLDSFLAGLKGIGRVTSRYETATDQSTQYADTELRLTTQREKMSRLQALLKQAADVSDLLEIETEIADTQYTLDQLESTLRTIDRDVERSAVSLTIVEQSAGDTAQAVELTLWQRIGAGFAASLRGLGRFGQNMLVFVAMLLPVLVPLAALAALGWLIHRAWRRKHPRPPFAPSPYEGFAAREPQGAAAPDDAADAQATQAIAPTQAAKPTGEAAHTEPTDTPEPPRA